MIASRERDSNCGPGSDRTGPDRLPIEGLLPMRHGATTTPCQRRGTPASQAGSVGMLLAPLLAVLMQADPKPIDSLPPLVEDAQAISPDHERIALSTESEGVWVLDIATRTVAVRVPPTASAVEHVTWSSDGTMLGLLHGNGEIEVVNAATGSLSAALNATSSGSVDGQKREIRFAAGGTVVIAVLGGHHTGLFATTSGERIAEIDSGSMVTAQALSPDGECLALGSIEGIVQFWNARTGARHAGEVRIRNDHRVDNGSPWRGYRGIHSLEFDPTGHLLAIGGGDCEAHLWCRDQQRVVRTFSTCSEEGFSTLGIGS